MKNFATVLACFLMFSTDVPVFAEGGKDKKAKQQAKASAVADDSTEIHWMSLDDVQVAMNKQPRKIWIDVYTGWCGWCKKMDRETFMNRNVIRYMNKHFYAVKLDAEQKEDIRFGGKMYKYNEARRVHDFAIEILRGQLSYPTSVFMAEGFSDPAVIPGYMDVKSMEVILNYLNTGAYKTVQFPDYQKSFVPAWM